MPYYDANLKSRLFVFSLPLDIQPLAKNKNPCDISARKKLS
jgi:hypothetical protein